MKTMPNEDANAISLIEQTGAGQIILYLFIHKENTGINITELQKQLKPARETILRTISFLAKKQIITEVTEKKFPFEHKVKLTEQGLRAAQHLAAFAEALQPQENKEE